MAGRPRGNQPRSEIIRIRITPSGKEAAERARGGLTMSDYVRGLIADDCKRKGI